MPARATAGLGGSALHLATSRAARLRLAPVADAMRALSVPCAVVDLAAEPSAGAAVAAAAEAAVARVRPAAVFLAGDGEAAVTAGLVCARLEVPIARVGAGLRCGDRTDAEEINRLVLDGLAHRLYADGDDAVRRLREEGVAPRRIRRVGTTLADVVARERPAALTAALWRALGLPRHRYVVAVLRRLLNDDERMARVVQALCVLARRAPTVVCVDPGTRTRMRARGDLAWLAQAGVRLQDGLAHTDFLSLLCAAGAVVTDSAGVQEEATLLGVPCFTARRATERVLTLTHGTNVLLGEDPAEIAEVPVAPAAASPPAIQLWDGRAGVRIARDFTRRRQPWSASA
jgi:UDP-N-acetylglucosamine 2-epimerase (non-hydrolysing)